MQRLFLYCHLALMGCLLASGCAGVNNSLRPSGKSSHWNMFNRNAAEKKDSKKKDKDRTIENMVVIWKDTVLEKQGAPAVRGFGGRIYFHDSENQAVKAEGELLVYGFDDSVTDTGRSRKPSKKFVFTNEQFQTHHSESDLGSSYSVWVPWEKVGGDQKLVSLVAIFKTTDGRTINSGSSSNVLPGKKPENDGVVVMSSRKSKAAGRNSISQASYSSGQSQPAQADQAVMTEEHPSSGIRSETINLTPSMASYFSTPVAAPSISPSAPGSKVTTFQPAVNSVKLDASAMKDSAKAADSPKTSTSQELKTTEDKPKKPTVFGLPGAFK
jgi:hypothetical protein